MTTGLNRLLAFAAGALTILSPCVLPLVPIVLTGAAQRHRFGPLALAAGLVISFTAVGFAVATLGTSLGLDGETVRMAGAVFLLAVGLLLLLAPAQRLFERATTPLANWAGERRAALERFGLLGQAGIGALLGLVWSPCVGPTLGAATVLAAQGRDLPQVAVVMASFGFGIATVLIGLAFATKRLLVRWRGPLAGTGGRGKLVLGGLLTIVRVLILTELDRSIETLFLAASPAWLVRASEVI